MKVFISLCIVLSFLMIFGSSTPLHSKVQVGELIEQKAETPHPYRGGGGIAYEEVFTWPEAGYISIHFSKFDLNAGDYVEISSPDGQFFHRYDGKGKKVKGGKEVISEFWASHIPGDTAVVRLYSKKRKGGFGFVIDKWVRGYEKGYIEATLDGIEGTPEASIEAICSQDNKEWAKCYSGTAMYEKGKAVSRLLISGRFACTGWLVGSEGHLMTNNHCISTQTEANNTDYEFMAEGASCTTNCSGWGDCPGVVEATSATLVKTDYNLDYALVLLPTNLTSKYGYLQLRNAWPTVGERIYIVHHPSHKGKQFSVNSDVDGPYCKIYSNDRPNCEDRTGPPEIGYYADTEGGSSGSPVIGYSDNLVVSLHHCAYCPNRGTNIPSIITHLGNDLPNDAIGTGGPVTLPPTAPSNLTGRAQKGGNVSLSWTDNSNNETGFKLYRGTSSSNLTLIATLGANTTSYTDTGLVKRTRYYYKVCAYNDDGESCSNTVNVRAR